MIAGVVALGVSAVLLGRPLAAQVAQHWLAIGNWPTAMLLDVVRANSGRAPSALNELARRYANGRLAPAAEDAAERLALAIQADPTECRTLGPALAVLDAALRLDRLDEAQLAQLFANGCSAELEVRAEVPVGANGEARIVLKPRLPAGCAAGVAVRSVRFGAEEISGPIPAYVLPGGSGGSWSKDHFEFVPRAPGETELVADVLLVVQSNGMIPYERRTPHAPPVLHEVARTLRAVVSVTSAPARIVELTDAASTDGVRERLTVREVRSTKLAANTPRNPGPAAVYELMVVLQAIDLPVPVAARLYLLRADGQRVELGKLTHSGMARGQSVFTLFSRFDEPPTDAVDLLIVGDPAVARSTAGMTETWIGELRLDKQPVVAAPVDAEPVNAGPAEAGP